MALSDQYIEEEWFHQLMLSQAFYTAQKILWSHLLLTRKPFWNPLKFFNSSATPLFWTQYTRDAMQILCWIIKICCKVLRLYRVPVVQSITYCTKISKLTALSAPSVCNMLLQWNEPKLNDRLRRTHKRQEWRWMIFLLFIQHLDCFWPQMNCRCLINGIYTKIRRIWL